MDVTLNVSDRHLSHAKHLWKCSESLCDSDYPDWYIVTAFYSCLHYVSAWRFREPVKVTSGGNTYDAVDINQYHNLTKKFHNNDSSKHVKLHRLAHDKDRSIAADYKWLLDLSMTLRYNRFQITETEKKEADARANSIRTVLEKELTG